MSQSPAEQNITPEEAGVAARWSGAPDPRFTPEDIELLSDLCMDLYIRGYRSARRMKEALDRSAERGVFINREDRPELTFIPNKGDGGFTIELVRYLHEIARQRVYFDKLRIETPEEAMRGDLNKLEHIEAIAWRKITELENSLDKDDVRGLFKATATILASQERRAKLLGLDSSTLIVTPKASESVAARIVQATLARTKRSTKAYGSETEESPESTAVAMLKERNLDDEDEDDNDEPDATTPAGNADGGEAKPLEAAEAGAIQDTPSPS